MLRKPLLTQLGKYPALLGLPNPDAPQGLAVWVRTLQNWLRKKEFQLSHGHLGPQVLSQPFVDIDIQAAWHHARQIAGGHAIPPEPAKPLSIGAAINALDALVNWAAAADSLTAPLSDGGGACSREVARPQSPSMRHVRARVFSRFSARTTSKTRRIPRAATTRGSA